jgi:hypothetical protein
MSRKAINAGRVIRQRRPSAQTSAKAARTKYRLRIRSAVFAPGLALNDFDLDMFFSFSTY